MDRTVVDDDFEAEPPSKADVADTITARIESGGYRPGRPIPSARALMAEFGISHRVAVDAMDLLRQRRLTYGQRSRGTRVRRRPERQAVNLDDVSAKLQAAIDEQIECGIPQVTVDTAWEPGHASRAQAAELGLEPAAAVVVATHRLFDGDKLLDTVVEVFDAEKVSLRQRRILPEA